MTENFNSQFSPILQFLGEYIRLYEPCYRSKFYIPRDKHLVIFIFKSGFSRIRTFKPVQIPLKALS